MREDSHNVAALPASIVSRRDHQCDTSSRGDMRRVAVQRLAHLSARGTHASAPLAATHAQAEKVTDQAEKLHFSVCGMASDSLVFNSCNCCRGRVGGKWIQ
jgi:hypothetical protein